MPSPRIEVHGANELRRELRRAGDTGLTKEFKEAGKEGAQRVAQTAASSFVPVVSGKLRATIRASGTLAGGVVRAGSARIRWAGPVHFGWPKRGIEPNPFLYEAADARAAEVVDVYYARVKKISDEIARRSQIKA